MARLKMGSATGKMGGTVRRSVLFSAVILASCGVSEAQSKSPDYGLGKTPTAEEIKAWDISIGPEGKGLPAGSGTAEEGAKIYAAKCALCHGQNGDGKGVQAPALAAVTSNHPPFPVQIPFAPVLWDYIRRAMPMLIGPGTLKPDEVYSLTAYLLFKNNVIKETEVLDAQTLPKVHITPKDPYVPPVVKPWNP